MASGRWLICNPESGDGTHVDQIHRLAADRALPVYETESAGHAAVLAREAFDAGIDELAVCGGDGTFQEVLSGLASAGAFDRVESGDVEADHRPVLSVIPAGTANILAADMGITDIETGFSTFDSGERRRLDVGLANGEPFMKSCIAGLTADTSSATSDELKERIGSIAFLVTGLARASEFDPLSLSLRAAVVGGEWTWEGEALCLVVGNARRYAGEIGQANVEDGLLDVTLVEEMPPGNVVTEAVARQLFGRETENVSRIETPRLVVEAAGSPVPFSLDGEIESYDRLVLTVRQQVVPMRVGPSYEPPGSGTEPDR